MSQDFETLPETIHQPPEAAINISFDLEKYRDYFDSTGFTKEQQDEFLHILWSIVTSFVRLGFDAETTQQTLTAHFNNQQEKEKGADL